MLMNALTINLSRNSITRRICY